MINKGKVVDYFYNHVSQVLDEQSVNSWCNDDENRQMLWDHEQDISDYENDTDENKEFYSQHNYSLHEAEQAIEDINYKLQKKWDFGLPFIQTINVSTHQNNDDFTFGWNINYFLDTSVGRFDVVVKTTGKSIIINISDVAMIGGAKQNVADDYDLFNDLERELIIHKLKN